MNVSDVSYAYKRYALHERGMRPKSYRSIMASVNMLCQWADTDDIRRLDHGIVRGFLYWGREEKLWEARTFRNHRQYLRSFLAWCVKQEYIKSNPTDNIEKPKLPRSLPRCLTREEVQVILNRTRWYYWRYQFEIIRNETMLYFLVYTGLRLQEMLDLELLDLDLAASEVLVRLGKGQKDRIVPIHPRLLPILKTYLSTRKANGNNSRFLFTGAKSEKPLCDKDVRRVCQKISQDTGVYFTPHMLRHTYGRLLVEAEVNIFKIKELMGHSSITTTQIYLSVSTENLKKTINDVVLF